MSLSSILLHLGTIAILYNQKLNIVNYYNLVEEVYAMKNNIKGRIVAKQTAPLPQSGKEYGYIVVEDDKDKEHIHMKVDANTNYNILKTGEHVDVKMEMLGISNIVRAIEVCESSA